MNGFKLSEGSIHYCCSLISIIRVDGGILRGHELIEDTLSGHGVVLHIECGILFVGEETIDKEFFDALLNEVITHKGTKGFEHEDVVAVEDKSNVNEIPILLEDIVVERVYDVGLGEDAEYKYIIINCFSTLVDVLVHAAYNLSNDIHEVGGFGSELDEEDEPEEEEH
jgi:hypothetical protein